MTIDFEVQKVVNPTFFRPPHLDAQISFNESRWDCAGIEAKFCEPYGEKRPGGLNACYLWETALWRDWPNIRAFAQKLSPKDLKHSHLHAARLLVHLLGLRKQNGTRFVLVYLWFDVPSASAARDHRQEIDSFGEVLKRDGIVFVSRTYQQRLRLALVRSGIPGWKVQPKGLPAKADFYFPEEKLLVFLDGCFWHGCPVCSIRMPRTDTEYWRTKLESNRARDARMTRELISQGFSVQRFWEHEVPECINELIGSLRGERKVRQLE
jgi:DNA mismatch endonuclease (patch repair protein)